MSTPLGKRRKLSTTSALLKPFKSPLRTSQDKYDNETPDPKVAKPKALGVTPLPKPISTPVKSHKNHSPHAALPDAARPNSALTQEVSSLQRLHTSLLNQLSSLRAELDHVDQALKIEASPRDEELKQLILQWRTASQQAAEEVYADVRDRVNGMGGIQAWRAREKKRGEIAWGWDEGGRSEQDNEDAEDTEDQPADADAEANEEAKAEMDDENENFTMDMMLRTLNIELDVIGYDKGNHRWSA